MLASIHEFTHPRSLLDFSLNVQGCRLNRIVLLMSISSLITKITYFDIVRAELCQLSTAPYTCVEVKHEWNEALESCPHCPCREAWADYNFYAIFWP